MSSKSPKDPGTAERVLSGALSIAGRYDIQARQQQLARLQNEVRRSSPAGTSLLAVPPSPQRRSNAPRSAQISIIKQRTASVGRERPAVQPGKLQPGASGLSQGAPLESFSS
jgi:hypothetical protein